MCGRRRRRLPWRVVEEVRAETEGALDEVGLDEIAAHLRLLLPKEDAVEEAVHPGDGGGHQVPLLTAELHIPPFLLLVSQVGDAGEQHAAEAAGRIIEGLAGLHVEHLGHEVGYGAVRVELGCDVTRVVGKFFDKILVALAGLALGQDGDGQFQRGEVLDEVAQPAIGQAVFIRPLGIAKDPEELVGVGRLDGPHGLLASSTAPWTKVAMFNPDRRWRRQGEDWAASCSAEKRDPSRAAVFSDWRASRKSTNCNASS